MTPGPTRRHKEHRMDTTKANPFEKNGKHLGKLTRHPQKYETTLLGRQRTGSRLTYLRRGESKGARQLKKAWKAYRKTNQEPQKYEANNTKITLGPRASFCRNKAPQRQRTKGNPFKEDGKHLRHKEHRRDGNKANQLKIRTF